MAGVFTAGFIALTAVYLTPAFTDLPKAVLGATVIVAVLSLVDLKSVPALWRYSKGDFAAWLTTVTVVFIIGVEAGIITGIGCSILCLLIKIARPHIAELGRVPGTEHFRNPKRHRVECNERIVSIRFDARLHFLNAHHLESTVADIVSRPGITDIVLQCCAINGIDATGWRLLKPSIGAAKTRGLACISARSKGRLWMGSSARA